MRTVLVDTGPLVAYLDPDDPAHDAVSSSFGSISGALCTTSAVITEAMYLLRDGRSGPRRLAEFVAAVGAHVFETTQPHHLLAAAALMEKYSDTPMPSRRDAPFPKLRLPANDFRNGFPIHPARGPFSPHENVALRRNVFAFDAPHLLPLLPQRIRDSIHSGEPCGIRLLQVLREIAEQLFLIADLALHYGATEFESAAIRERRKLIPTGLDGCIQVRRADQRVRFPRGAPEIQPDTSNTKFLEKVRGDRDSP